MTRTNFFYLYSQPSPSQFPPGSLPSFNHQTSGNLIIYLVPRRANPQTPRTLPPFIKSEFSKHSITGLWEEFSIPLQRRRYFGF